MINPQPVTSLGIATINGAQYVRCDALGCRETHPLDHDMVGEPSYGTGHWLGWIYVDLNRPDLMRRELRFCSTYCVQWWLERQSADHMRQPLTPLDEALRRPNDSLARKRAGIKGGAS